MPPTYEIEHIPAGGGTPVRQSPAAWGCAFRLRDESWGIASLTLTDTTTGAAFLAPVFGYLDQIVLWRDGTRRWRGWVTTCAAQATPESEARPYTIQGAGWWLAKSPWMLGWTGTRTNRTVGQWVSLALQRAIYLGAPIALGTPETDYALSMPAPDLLDSDTCWTVIQRAARYAPNSAGWWDDSGAVSVFRTRARADLSTVSLDLGSQATVLDELAALEESQLVAVRLIYGHWYDGVGGETWETYTRDRAGDNDATGPNVLEVRIEVESYDVALTSVGYDIAAKLMAAIGPLSWAGRLTCDESAASVALVRPGQALNLTGGRTEWASMAAVVAAVELIASPEADTCTIELGPPPPLGPQDFLELFRVAGQAGNSVSGNPGPYDPPTPPAPPTDDTQPGTIDDLNDTGGAAPVGTIAIQTRGGTWTKKGFAEFPGHVSTPPRYYLTRSPSGSAVLDCSTSLYCADTISATGSIAYDPSTDVITPMSLTQHGATADSISGIPSQVYPYCNPGSWQLCYEHTSGTVAEYWHGKLADCSQGGDGTYCSSSGKYRLTQGTEDTESAAIARRLAVATWTSANTAAVRTIPSTVASGIYDELRWGTYVGETYTPLTGLSPWQRYRACGVIEMQPVDELGAATGDWYAAGETSSAWIASIDGTGGCEWQYIAPTAGYRTRISGLTVEEW